MSDAIANPNVGETTCVSVSKLRASCDLSRLGFETSAELDEAPDLVGQDRALEALHLGANIRASGFNVFAIGSNSSFTREAVCNALRKDAARRAPPADWVYVNNFATPHRPVAIELPHGRAGEFRDQMHELILDLKLAIPAAFEGAEYQSHRDMIDETARHAQEEIFSGLRDKAAARDVAILRSPMGFGLAPVRNGKIVPPEEFQALPEADKIAAQKAIEALEPELEQALRALPRLEKERRDAFRSLDRQTAAAAVGQTIDEAKRHFADLPQVLSHLETIREDLVENVALFVMPQTEGAAEAARTRPGGPFDRYEVNVIVASADGESGAPVIEEQHPTLGNLTGRVEHIAQDGMLITNFRLIKAGVLHRANGGFLLIDARALLSEPYSWQALKRALLQKQIVIEDLAHSMGLSSTVSLEPDPIPLDVRVVLFGDRALYYLLLAADPDTAAHFKVLADFNDDIARSAASEEQMARSLAGIVRRERFKPVDRAGLERLLEHATRTCGDSEKFSLDIERMRDVIAEANFVCEAAAHERISAGDVERAIAQRIGRANRIELRARESIERRIALIDTQGSRVGQVNGLSVVELGGHAFGTPTRITCRVRPGAGKIVDIEREVELGGPIHSKGVLILSGYLAGRYALQGPMSLFASIVLEQSYGGIEGDSASAAELCALLSAIGEIPLRQDCAMTGSVNQHGDIQAIGGVNEKIEGFFDLCHARGLSGTQCVLIPAANVQHLMLRADVVAACASGQFRVHAIESIDQAMSILSGLAAGDRDADGAYVTGSFNRRVEDRLASFARSIAAARGRDRADAES